MKKLILSLCAALLLPLPALAGDVAPGSVPGTLNYQGRLERDNAPVTGPVHIYFRIYNSPTAVNASGGACGGIAQPCLWESPEITAQATQGIFSADLTPPTAILSGGERLYLEVQVESDTLSPREPLNSVAYAVVAKRLEDGASVRVTTLTANYNVLLATATGAQVGIGGVISPSRKLTVDGDIEIINGGALRFLTSNSAMTTANIGTVAGGITSPSANATIEAGTGYNILFGIPNTTITGEKARITSAGDFGIGTLAPGGKLDVNGSLFVGNEGISDRVDNEVNISEDLVVMGGRVRGIGNNYITLGLTTNNIVAATNNVERLWLNDAGNLGVGATPLAGERVYASGNIRATNGARGGSVSIGAYNNTWTGLTNEVRAITGSHLLLQQTNPFNVGIGTDTPREKLHVRGSVLADYGVIAATAAFSGNVRVDGDLDANSSNGNMVYLSSTIVYGSLQVTGGIGSMAGIPAYIASSNTFTGQNTFSNQMTVSSDVIVNSRLGVGAISFDFPGDDYLQVGGNTSEFAHNAAAYLVAGSTGEARVAFYRGPVKAASLETLSGNYLPNLALVVGGQAKTVTDSVYHRIQNSVVWISTGYNTTPSIFVSSTIGNVGIGISVLDPNWKLTVDGNIRISRNGGGLLFPDGTSITTGNLGALSVGNVSNNSDAVIQSNADLSGGGNVVLRAGSLDGLVLNTGGNVGIGTISPVSRLNVRGGDLVLGTPLNPYSSDSVEDLVVAGNIAFDGELLQRSNSQVRLSGLMVASDVYLSTGAAARTGIGTITPQTKLEVNGDAQFGSGLTKSTFTSAGALQLASDLAVQYGGTGAGTFTDGGVLFGNGTAAIGVTNVLNNGQLLIGDGTQEPTLATLTQTANQVLITNGAGSITLSLPQDIHTAADPTFDLLTLTTPLGVGSGGTGVNTITDGGILFGNGTAAVGNTGVLANGQLLIGDGTQEPTVATLTGTANQVIVTNGAGSITLSLPQNIHTGGNPTFSAITTSSSGTFKASGAAQYSIATASGIFVSAGVINMNTNKIVGLADPQHDNDAVNLAYVNNVSGGGYGAWGLRGNNINDLTDFLGTTGLDDDLVFKTAAITRMTITSGGVINLSGFGLGAVISDASGNLATGNYAASASVNGPASDVACTNCISLGTETNGTYDTTADTIADDGVIALGTETSGTYDSTADTIGDNGSITLSAAGSEVTGILPVANGGTGNATGNAATVTNGFYTNSSLAGDVTGNPGTNVVGDDSHNHSNTTITGGATGTFDVAISTTAPAQCKQLTITNGIITAIGANHNCD